MANIFQDMSWFQMFFCVNLQVNAVDASVFFVVLVTCGLSHVGVPSSRFHYLNVSVLHVSATCPVCFRQSRCCLCVQKKRTGW